MAGRATLVKDRKRMEELCSPMLKVWFPDGLETDGIALLKVEAETAEYWDASSSMVKKAVGAVKAAVQKDPGDFPAENRTVEL